MDEHHQQQQLLLLQYASTEAASAHPPNDTDARIQDWISDTQSRAEQEQAGQEEQGQAGEDVGEEDSLHNGLLEMQRLLGLEAAGEEGGGGDDDDDHGDGDGDTSSRPGNGKRKRQRSETATRTDSSTGTPTATGKPRRRRTIKQPSLQYAACVPPRVDDFNRGFASLNPTMWTWVTAEEGEESARKRRRPEGGPPLRARMPTVPSWGPSTRAPPAREENNLQRHLRAATPTPSVAVAAAGGTSKATKKALTMMARFRRDGNDDDGGSPRRPSPFFRMPQEVRDAVYRNLLVSGRPVPVHDGWRSVLRLRGRAKDAGLSPGLGLQPAVLRACYRAYVEGVRVLYGENTFLYKLRDPLARMAPPVADVPRLAYGGGGGEGDDGEPMDITGSDDEGEGEDDDDDSGSEYEDESETRARTAPKQRGGRKRHAEQDDDDDDDDGGGDKESARKNGRARINVARFYHLFRYIAIEAESNRCSTERLEHMVRAINVWTSPPRLPSRDFLARHVRAAAAKGGDHLSARAAAAPPTGGKKPAGKKPNAAVSRRKSKKQEEEEKEEEGRLAPPANIYSLAIRFSPMRTRDSFTFVDFFGPESPLTAALKRLETQFLYVVIKTQHLILSPHEQEFGAASLMQQQWQRQQRGQGEDGAARTHGSRFVVNLRLHRLRRRVGSGRQADPWADDAGLTARARAEGAARSLGVIDGLGESVEGCCRRWVEQNGVGLLEDDWWDEYDDQLDDDGDGSWGG